MSSYTWSRYRGKETAKDAVSNLVHTGRIYNTREPQKCKNELRVFSPVSLRSVKSVRRPRDVISTLFEMASTQTFAPIVPAISLPDEIREAISQDAQSLGAPVLKSDTVATIMCGILGLPPYSGCGERIFTACDGVLRRTHPALPPSMLVLASIHLKDLLDKFPAHSIWNDDLFYVVPVIITLTSKGLIETEKNWYLKFGFPISDERGWRLEREIVELCNLLPPVSLRRFRLCENGLLEMQAKRGRESTE